MNIRSFLNLPELMKLNFDVFLTLLLALLLMGLAGDARAVKRVKHFNFESNKKMLLYCAF